MNNTINLFNECCNWGIYLDNGIIMPRNQACKPQISNNLEMNCRCKCLDQSLKCDDETFTNLVDLCFSDYCSYDFENLTYIGESPLSDFIPKEEYQMACKYIKCRQFVCTVKGTDRKAYVIGYLPTEPDNEDCIIYVSYCFYIIENKLRMFQDVQKASLKAKMEVHKSNLSDFEKFSIFFKKSVDDNA